MDSTLNKTNLKDNNKWYENRYIQENQLLKAKISIWFKYKIISNGCRFQGQSQQRESMMKIKFSYEIQFTQVNDENLK